MANSKKSRKTKQSETNLPNVRIFATPTGYIIGQVYSETSSVCVLTYAFGLGLLENQSGVGFSPIRFYDVSTQLEIHKAMGISYPAPKQIELQYLTKVAEINQAQSQ